MNPQSVGQPAKFHGLMNQGATCYLNSVLQVLFMTDDFKDRVKRHRRINARTEHIDSELSDLFNDLEQREAYTFKVTNKLKITNVHEQRDAAEHYEKILRLTSPEASQIFRGELINRNTCLKCRTQTESVAGFWHLPLALVDSHNQYSVVKGIEEFFRSSEIRGEDQMYCELCDEKCDAVLDCEVKHHPEVLVLLLKRFEFDRWMRKVKINCFVDVPYTLHVPQNQVYELYACVEHYGELRCGHYISRIKSQDDGRWYIFDDSRVTKSAYQHYQLDPTERSRTAYLLFYRRQTAQDANTVPPDFSNRDTTELSEVEITNRTEDTQSPTEEKEGVENDDHVHIKKHKQDKRKAQALAERTRNEQRRGKNSRDDCHKQFHDNCNLGGTDCSRNDSDSVCIDIPEDENTQSQTFNDRVTNTQWNEIKGTTMKTQELCNIASAVKVNTSCHTQTQMKDIRRTYEGNHGEHKQRGRKDEAVKRQLLVSGTAHTPELSSDEDSRYEEDKWGKDGPTQRPEDHSETGAHVSAETRKEYQTVKYDRDVQDNVRGNRFHRLSDETCNTVSDKHENDSTNFGLSGVPVSRNYSRQTYITLQTGMKDAPRGKSVKTREDKHLDRRLKSSVRTNFGASVQDQGRTRFRQHPQQCLLSEGECQESYSRVKATNTSIKDQEQNKNERSGANYHQDNQRQMVVWSEVEGIETNSVKNLQDRQASGKRNSDQDHSRQQKERLEQEVSREASWSNNKSDQRGRTGQWLGQNPSYSQRNTRHKPHGGGHRGDNLTRGSHDNRSYDVTNSPEVLAEGVNNLTLSNQYDMKEEQKRRGGKKQGSKRSRESETGLSGNEDAVMHKQGSLTEDQQQVQIKEEFKTNQPRKRKMGLWCLPLCTFKKKRKK